MRAYMIEKLIMVVNQARIIYNALQPNRPALGIRPACKRVILFLVNPFLKARKAKQASKKRRRAAGHAKEKENVCPLTAVNRSSWGKAQHCWDHAMAVELSHLPVKWERTRNSEDARGQCRQCLRQGFNVNGKKDNRTPWHCEDCANIRELPFLPLHYPECWTAWHRENPGGHNLRPRQ